MSIKKWLKGSSGFSFTELIFVTAITAIVMAVAVTSFVFTNKTWTEEGCRTTLRIDMLKFMETIENDVRASSATYMAFYPPVSGEYTAISMPFVSPDANGFLPLDANNKIAWTKTIVYHIVPVGSAQHLKRTVIDYWNSSMTQDERNTFLQSFLNGAISGTYTTATAGIITQNLESFTISPLTPFVDFYNSSTTPVGVEDVLFGYIRLDPGEHSIEFTVTGKKTESSGYALGIDYVKIDPCGSKRNAEYYSSSYAPSGSITSSGDAVNIVSDSVWNNNNYLEYRANGINDFVGFIDNYDVWRETVFDNCLLGNMRKSGDDIRLKLELPEDRDSGVEQIYWTASAQTGDSALEGTNASLPAYPVVLRTIVKGDAIDKNSEMIRVCLAASSENPLKVDRVYVTRKEVAGDTGDFDGLANLSPSGLTEEQYHRHQELFFKDVYDMDGDSNTTEILKEACIPRGGTTWSEWSAFPLAKTLTGSTDVKDYLITMVIPDLGSVTFPAALGSYDASKTNCKGWVGSLANSWYVTSGTVTTAGTPSWSDIPLVAGEYTQSSNIYVVSKIDTWNKTGSVDSYIFDTTLDDPAYTQARWSEPTADHTEVALKVRTSDSSIMDSATAWDAVTGATDNPATLSAGDRYVQFRMEVTSDFTWKAASSELSYVDYVTEQVGYAASGNYWQFPEVSSQPMVSACYSTWIDDVEIDWDGEPRICAIRGNIVKKNNYGQAKVTVDGNDLVKVLKIYISLGKDFQGRMVREKNSMEIEPRKTGR